jgi:hypothetical protein
MDVLRAIGTFFLALVITYVVIAIMLVLVRLVLNASKRGSAKAKRTARG